MNSYEKEIERLRSLVQSDDVTVLARSLLDAVALLDKMNDERLSAWQMLDEIKASEIKHHKDVQDKTIENALARVKSLMMTKVGKA